MILEIRESYLSQDIIKFIERLLILSNEYNHPLLVDTAGWVARPVTTTASQTNSYDCGMWVLAGIAATLRGHHTVGMSESDVREFRNILYLNVLSLPVALV